MIETEEKLENLEVVKRNGRKVEFDGTKVALAIKKGFDSVTAEDAEEKKYTSKDIQKVYQAVIKKIAKEYLPNGKIKIEEVQDLSRICLRNIIMMMYMRIFLNIEREELLLEKLLEMIRIWLSFKRKLKA